MTEQMKKIKNSFSKAGLSTMALYGVFQAVASIGLIMGVIPVAVAIVLKQIQNNAFSSGASLAQTYQTMLSEIPSNPLMFIPMLTYALGSVGGMLLGILIMKLILQSKKNEPIEKKILSKKEYITFLFISFGVWAVGVLIGNLPGILGVQSNNMMSELFDSLGINYLPMLLYAVIGAPIVEELALRKTLLDKLHSVGEFPAAVVSGLLFGLIHGNSGQFFLAAFLGFIWAIVYQKTGKIIYSISFHMCINFVGSITDILKLFGVSGLPVDISWYALIGILGVIGLVILFLNRKNDLLKVQWPLVDQANSLIFKNIGMRLALILGFISLAFTDIMGLVNSLTAKGGAKSFLILIPTVLTGVLILVLAKTVCKKHYVDNLVTSEGEVECQKEES